MSIITNIRTIRLKDFPNSIWAEIETDGNLTGLNLYLPEINEFSLIYPIDTGRLSDLICLLYS